MCIIRLTIITYSRLLIKADAKKQAIGLAIASQKMLTIFIGSIATQHWIFFLNNDFLQKRTAGSNSEQVCKSGENSVCYRKKYSDTLFDLQRPDADFNCATIYT